MLPTADRVQAMQQAVRSLLAGDGAAAEPALLAILGRDPTDAVALANYGMSLQLQRRHKEAERVYREVLALVPGHPEASFNLGSVLLAQGRRHEAGAALQRAMARAPQKPVLRAAAIQARLIAEAKLHPDDLAAPAAAGGVAALLQRGLLLRGQGLGPAATDCFHQVLALEPGHGPAAWLAGEDCFWSGRVAEARHDLTVALGWLAANWQPAPAPPLKRFDRASARRALFTVLDALDGAGITWFLNGGTALGCVREGDFISFDSDLDIGVAPGTDPAAVVEAIETRVGIEYRYHDTYRDRVLRVRFAEPDGVGGDVFLYQETEEGFWCGVQRGPHALRWRDTPFGRTEATFLGRMVWLPNPVDRYLEENYGPGWRVPDPGHVPGFSAPNLMEPRSELSRCMIYMSIGAALSQGDAERAERYCGEALARFPGDLVLADVLARIRTRMG